MRRTERLVEGPCETHVSPVCGRALPLYCAASQLWPNEKVFHISLGLVRLGRTLPLDLAYVAASRAGLPAYAWCAIAGTVSSPITSSFTPRPGWLYIRSQRSRPDLPPLPWRVFVNDVVVLILGGSLGNSSAAQALYILVLIVFAAVRRSR